jgi:hypothetical protein
MIDYAIPIHRFMTPMGFAKGSTGGIACVVFRQQDVQHRAERLGSFLWKRQKMPRSDFREVSLFVIPNHPVVHWVKERFKPLW